MKIRFPISKMKVAFICLPLLIIIISALQVVSAQEHVSGYGEICYPCHNTILSLQEKNTKLAHCRCHSVDIWRGSKIDMRKLSELHGDSPCIRCHASPQYTSESYTLGVHEPHSGIECSSCHGEGAVAVPETESCMECHQGGVHEIHENVLIDVCVGCHGKVINKFAELREEVGVVKTTTPIERVEEKSFSIFDIIKNFLSFFFGGNR